MMFKPLSAVLLTFAPALTFYSASSQTAEEIISHYVNAVGGKAVLDNVHSIIYEGVSNVMGNDLPTKVTVVQGKGFKTVTMRKILKIQLYFIPDNVFFSVTAIGTPK